MPSQVIFEERLIYLTEKRQAFTFNQTPKAMLTTNAIIWYADGNKHQLSLDDVVGVSIAEDSINQMPCLTVNAYPLVQWGKFSVKRQRILREYKFACPNIEVRSRWLQVINNTLRGFPLDEIAKTPRLQILINPISGKKQARKIFAQVRPLLERSHLHFTVTETFSAEETRNFLQKIALEEIDSLVIVGGDGTIHEAIDCLMSRDDWQTAIQTTIGVIPAGTGNGLCKSLLELSGEPYDPISAAFLIAKGKKQPCDLVTFKQNSRRYYSFLSLSWAIASDVDIESERLRFLGYLRTEIYALMRIINLRSYKGRFSFLPHSDWKNPSNQSKEWDGEWQVIEDEFLLFWAMNAAWANHSMKPAPYAQLADGAMDVLLVRRGASRLDLLSAFLRCAKGEHIFLPCMEYYKVRCFRLEPLTDRGILAIDGEQVNYSPIEMKVIKGLAQVMCG